VETALKEELFDHLGYDEHDPAGRNGANSRTGTRRKTVLTDTVGEIEIQVLRDRDGSFESQIVTKRQPRLTRIDEIVLSLYATGLTTGEIAAHFDELYEARISADTISRITAKIVADMAVGDQARRDFHDVAFPFPSRSHRVGRECVRQPQWGQLRKRGTGDHVEAR
jgi:transposase-like protein